MTAPTRVFPNSVTDPSPPGVGGEPYATLIKVEGEALWDRSITDFTVDARSSPNSIMGACSPSLTSGPADGQRFRFTVDADNDDDVWVDLDGVGYISLVNSLGEALEAGALEAGETVDIAYSAASEEFRLVSVSIGHLGAMFETTVVDIWQEIYEGALPAAVQLVIPFGANQYTALLVQVIRASPLLGVAKITVELRNSTGRIIGPQLPTAFSTAADIANVRTEFDLDTRSGTKLYHARMYGAISGTPVLEVAAVASNASAADRVMVSLSASVFDGGRVRVVGLRA